MPKLKELISTNKTKRKKDGVFYTRTYQVHCRQCGKTPPRKTELESLTKNTLKAARTATIIKRAATKHREWLELNHL
jgi:hypothetical protein